MYGLNEDDTLSHRNSHSTEIEDEDSSYDDSENNGQIDLVDSIGNQLNQVREDMHKDFLTFRSKNNHGVIEKNHSNDLKEMIGDNTPKTDKSHIWKPNTTLITGDSILLGIDESRISGINESRISSKRNIKVRAFKGATVQAMYDYIKPLLKKCPSNIILHIGANDTIDKTSRQILDEIILLKQFIQTSLPAVNVVISTLTQRLDNPKASLTVNHLNKHLYEPKLDLIDDSNINGNCISR